MAFNKVFLILALASCALAMPVHPVDETTATVEVQSTSALIDNKAENSTITITTTQESITTIATEETTNKDEESAADSTPKPVVPEELVDQDVVKRSIDEESSADDLETAAGTNVLRPLFVYRQQVAYRQRVRNAHRRGTRRF